MARNMVSSIEGDDVEIKVKIFLLHKTKCPWTSHWDDQQLIYLIVLCDCACM